MTIRPELLDELLKDYQTPQDLFGENGIIKQLTKGMIERCLQAEMEAHLGYQAWTKEDREHQHPQWLRSQNAQERARRVADQRAA